MARTTYGISTSAITWEKTESEISISETGMAEITVEGAVNSTGIGLLDALRLIPNTLPIGNNGPIGSAPDFAGAAIKNKSAYYKEGTWQVRATYQKSSSITAEFDGNDVSDNDRAERRVIVTEEPILSHPVAMKFDRKQKNLLANLLDGYVIPNINKDYNGGVETQFVMADDNGKFVVPVEFSGETETAGGVTASPDDFAQMIKAGITTYQRKSIRHTWSTSRNEPASDADYKKVGSVFENPPLAPSIADGAQWLLSGIVDSSQNGQTWNTTYEFDASGAGGWLRPLYEGGTGELTTA